MKKNYNIKSSIGIFENSLSEEVCDWLIKNFEAKKDNLAYSRQGENVTKKIKNDLSISYDKMNNWDKNLELVCKSVVESLKIYNEETGFMSYAGVNDLHFTNIKVQKTRPAEGYHVWHIERDYRNHCRRALVFSIFLNDIEEGGETEFLLLRERIKPKKGTLVIFPADYPFVHRGNPPLSGEKYLLTSWLLS